MESDEFLHLLSEEESSEDQLKALHHCLEKLPEEQRTSITRFFLEEMSYADIIGTNRFTLNNVKSYIQNGKRNLKNLYQETNPMKLLDYIRGLRKGKGGASTGKRVDERSFSGRCYGWVPPSRRGSRTADSSIADGRGKRSFRPRKRNKYAITWSIAACLMIGIGISSYFLLLKQSIEDNVLEQVSSVSIQRCPDSSHIPIEKK